MNESANNLNMWLNIKPTPKPSDFDPENGFESTFGKFEMEKAAQRIVALCAVGDDWHTGFTHGDFETQDMDCFTLRMNSLKD
jgi:hypothetical protein